MPNTTPAPTPRISRTAQIKNLTNALSKAKAINDATSAAAAELAAQRTPVPSQPTTDN